jgi:hypothetical protein
MDKAKIGRGIGGAQVGNRCPGLTLLTILGNDVFDYLFCGGLSISFF